MAANTSSANGHAKDRRARRRRGPAPGTPRAPRLPRAEREEQILAIAEQVFAEHGYQVATMEEVAERAGITKPVIYDYFGSKEGLLSACINRARAQLRESTVSVWAAQPKDSPLGDFFRVGVQAFFDWIDDHVPAFTLIQQEGALLVTAGPGIESIRVQQSKAVVEALSRIPRLKHIPPLLLEGYAEVMIGTCERVAIWRTRHPEITATEATDMVLSALWTGFEGLLGEAGGAAPEIGSGALAHAEA